MDYDNLTDYDAYVRALVLAVTAPDHRFDEAIELAETLARRLTPDEVHRGMAAAEQLLEGAVH